MRIISQDGKCDYPYENRTLFIDYMDGRAIRILPSATCELSAEIAVYSTEEKAKWLWRCLEKHTKTTSIIII